MLISRWKIREILKKQAEADELHRGYSPSLVYGCFNDLGTDETNDVCEKCGNYHHCYSYLRAVEIILNPFEKEKMRLEKL